jgi:cytoskeletal protein CcmA (bactofilin family)
MLNKQGLFSRREESTLNRVPVQTAVSPQLAAGKATEPSLMPGHLAAIESATTLGAASSETKSNIIAKSDASSGSRLIVGPDVKLKGAEILDCDTLIVEGRVEATMDSRVIQIAANGAFSGKVGIDVAEIRGQFDGELTARSQLIIYSTGRVSGKIRYGKILIEEGGELSGDVATISDNGGSVSRLRPNEALNKSSDTLQKN